MTEASVSIGRIMKGLGHSDDKTTKQIYWHTTDSNCKKNSEKFANLIKNVITFYI